MTIHYNERYYEWQRMQGMVSGKLEKFKFEEHIKEFDTVLDFGCGGGFILSAFDNIEKLGFEINKSAWDDCEKNGVKVTDDFNNIDDESVDVIISNHALEHVHDPLEHLKQLCKKLKTGGTFVLVLPLEQNHETQFHYSENDINQHLYTWCPMSIGNLCKLAGFKVISSNTIEHQFCPDYLQNYSQEGFHERCIENAKNNKNLQIKLVGSKD